MKLVLVQPQLRVAADADNLAVIRAHLAASGVAFEPHDIVLLPESAYVSDSPENYARDIAALARALGCHVVGGSRRETVNGGALNSGLVFDPCGEIIGRYEKLRPYAGERQLVGPGGALGECVIAGRNVLILICADFWFADLLQRATRVPDLILVPACSVTRKPTPEYSRALWRHLAVARAYEFGVYVGISDWGFPSELPTLFASGVGGFADPTTSAPEQLFAPIGAAAVTAHRVDFAALEAFRQDRTARGFFWTSAARIAV